MLIFLSSDFFSFYVRTTIVPTIKAMLKPAKIRRTFQTFLGSKFPSRMLNKKFYHKIFMMGTFVAEIMWIFVLMFKEIRSDKSWHIFISNII